MRTTFWKVPQHVTVNDLDGIAEWRTYGTCALLFARRRLRTKAVSEFVVAGLRPFVPARGWYIALMAEICGGF